MAWPSNNNNSGNEAKKYKYLGYFMQRIYGMCRPKTVDNDDELYYGDLSIELKAALNCLKTLLTIT